MRIWYASSVKTTWTFQVGSIRFFLMCLGQFHDLIFFIFTFSEFHDENININSLGTTLILQKWYTLLCKNIQKLKQCVCFKADLSITLRWSRRIASRKSELLMGVALNPSACTINKQNNFNYKNNSYSTNNICNSVCMQYSWFFAIILTTSNNFITKVMTYENVIH